MLSASPLQFYITGADTVKGYICYQRCESCSSATRADILCQWTHYSPPGFTACKSLGHHFPPSGLHYNYRFLVDLLTTSSIGPEVLVLDTGLTFQGMLLNAASDTGYFP